METLFTSTNLISFLTLCALELVLGIDNIIFISILAGKLPADQRARARTTGLALAVISRILLLLSLSWLVGLTAPLFTVLSKQVSGRDLILIIGGIFLIAKSTHEIHGKIEGEESISLSAKSARFGQVIFQILLLDIVFSIDSVITAVGMVDNLPIMIAAVIISTLVMIFSSKSVSQFVEDHPTIKMLALSFLLLIGFTLIADGFGHHVPKGYIYFSMGFSLFVEFLNLKIRKKKPTAHIAGLSQPK